MARHYRTYPAGLSCFFCVNPQGTARAEEIDGNEHLHSGSLARYLHTIPSSWKKRYVLKNGISTNQNVTDSATCLKQAGIDFVFRYYSTTTTQPAKRLTQAEANAILGAGLMLGVVYEDMPTDATYFSNARGHQDATNAFSTAVAMGRPAGSAIYFTVDYDASSPDISGPILDYFNGVNQGMQDGCGELKNDSSNGPGPHSRG
jgi:hypothetical protein